MRKRFLRALFQEGRRVRGSSRVEATPRLLLPIALLVALAAGCAAEAKAPPKSVDQSDAGVDPQSALDTAERELDLALKPSPGAVPSAQVAQGPAAGKGPEEKAYKDDERRFEHDEGGPCHTACVALASMERAATRLCTMTGDRDARCDGAKTRLRRATERVQISCPVCAAAKK